MLWRRTCGRSPLQLVIVRGPLQEFLLSHRSLIRMLISGMRVRCTGHLLAISSGRECCSVFKDPSNCTSGSILSSMPSLVSHSEQSAAYVFECRSQTLTGSSGQFFFAHRSRPSSRSRNPERRAKSRKGMARYQCLQRYPAHRLLGDAGLPQSAPAKVSLHLKR